MDLAENLEVQHHEVLAGSQHVGGPEVAVLDAGRDRAAGGQGRGQGGDTGGRQAGLLQKELHVLTEDMGRLDERVEKLAIHFRQTSKDIEDIQTSARKVSRRAEKITTMDLGEEEAAAPLDTARPATARGWIKGPQAGE